MKRWLRACAAAALLLPTAGCLRRTLSVRTEPAGALVYVNDQLRGETPLEYDFEWYGWHRVTVRKEGYARIDDRRLIRAPVYLWIPLDLVVELLPFPVHDRREWSYALAEQTVDVPEAPAIEGGSQESMDAPDVSDLP